MKQLRLLPYCLCLSVIFLWACNKEEVLPLDEMRVAATCSVKGLVKANSCGLYVELNSGHAIYAERYPDKFVPEEGMPVILAYYRINSNQSSSHSGGECGGGSSSSSQSNTTGDCMSRWGISQASVQCIQRDTDS